MKHFPFAISLFVAAALFAAPKVDIDLDFTNPDVLAGKFPLKLRGAARLDGGLASLETDAAKASGAATRRVHPEFTPEAAFRLEAAFVLDPGWKPAKSLPRILFDNKSAPLPPPGPKQRNHGLQIHLKSVNAARHLYTVVAAFGYGETSAAATSDKVELKPGVTHTVSLTYDAIGTAAFVVDGKPAGKRAVPAGRLSPAKLPAVFGDRAVSNFQPLGGRLLRFTLSAIPFTPVTIHSDPMHRTVFERLEPDAAAHFTVGNHTAAPLPACTIRAALAGSPLPPAALPALQPGASASVAFPVDTRLLPGDYDLECTAEADGKPLATGSIRLTIVPSYGDFLPFILKGVYTDEVVRDTGFTHTVCSLFPRRGDYTPDLRPRHIARLDEMLRHGLYAYDVFREQTRFLAAGRFVRTGRDGKPYPRPNLEASHPDARREYLALAEQIAKGIGDHPAWDNADINNEVRDHCQPSFGGPEPAAFRKFAGYDIPQGIVSKGPSIIPGAPGFPWDGILPDDWPELVFLKWFFREGDGWNSLGSAMSATLHRHIRRHFFTITEPSVRVPPIWGSGGTIDTLNQWTYSNPDPLKNALAVDELRAMAGGRDNARLGHNPQSIWYRKDTAPMHLRVPNPPEWLSREPGAAFITPAPDMTRESYWFTLSRRLDVLLTHGAGSLFGNDLNPKHGYRHTNPETRKVLQEISRTLLRPLGPVLKRVPERPAEVAILESATSNFYAGRHFTLGWGRGWVADLHLALQWAGLQPSILYEEHLATGRATAALKVLFVPGASVLTQSVLKNLLDLQARGVILVGDEFTTPALPVDYRIHSVARRQSEPKGTKLALQKLGQEIASTLRPHYRAPRAASTPDLVLHSRGTDAADYLFLVNDRRTFGDYVGQFGYVMEKGLPLQGNATVAHPAAAAYDLVNHREIPLAHADASSAAFDIHLPPGGGALVLLLASPLADVQATLPGDIRRGEAFALKASITDATGKPAPAILPVEVTLTDAKGTRLPGSGYYAAPDGRLALSEVAAPNMAPGTLTAVVKCLASGKTATVTATVK